VTFSPARSTTLANISIARAAPTNTIDLFDHNPTKPTREGLLVAQGG